jgi:hypothetical protein
MADRLSKGQTQILDLGQQTFLEAQSAARSGRMLVNFTFSKLTPAQRLSELEDDSSPLRNELKARMSNADFEQLVDSVKAQKIRSSIASTASEVQRGIVGIVGLADAMGLSFAKKPEFRKSANIASGLAGGIASYFSGNPIDAISSIGGMFGGGSGISSGEQRILAKLAEMDAKLDTLLQGQQEILMSLENSTNTLVALNNQILEDTSKINSGLDLLFEQTQTTLLTIEGFSEFLPRYNRCSELRDDISEWSSTFKAEQSYSEFRQDFSRYSVVFDPN